MKARDHSVLHAWISVSFGVLHFSKPLIWMCDAVCTVSVIYLAMLSVSKSHNAKLHYRYWMVDRKGFGRRQSCLIRDNIKTFAWKDWEKPRKNSDYPVSRPRFEPNGSKVIYRYANLSVWRLLVWYIVILHYCRSFRVAYNLQTWK
jgi:hypothetical protein